MVDILAENANLFLPPFFGGANFFLNFRTPRDVFSSTLIGDEQKNHTYLPWLAIPKYFSVHKIVWSTMRML